MTRLSNIRLYLKNKFQNLTRNDFIFITIIFVGIFGAILSTTPIRKGDGTEYMLTTEALFFDHSLRYSESTYQRHLKLKAASLDGVGFIYNKGHKGYYLTQHPLYYSLSSTVLYGVFYLINPKLAYWSFFVTNLVFLVIVISYLLIYFNVNKVKYSYLLTISYIFLSTLYPYIFWQHPETFIFFTVASFYFFLYIKKKPIISCIFLGLAVGQSLVLVFLILNLLYYFINQEKKEIKQILISGFIFVFISSVHYIITYLLTGNLFSLKSNADFSFKSFYDFWLALFDPATGLIWFYPMVIFSLVFSKKELKTIIILLSTFLSLLFFMINKQYYTHQVGLRYLNYIYPAFFFILDPKQLKSISLKHIIIIAFSAFLTVGIISDVRLSNDSMDISKKNFVIYKLIKRFAPNIYQEHPTILAARAKTLGIINAESMKYPRSLAVYIEDDVGDKYYQDRWFGGNKWVRLLINPVEVGHLQFNFFDSNRFVYAKLNSKEYKASNGILNINLEAKDIQHSTKLDGFSTFTDYIYIDFMFESWCPCNSGSKDTRNLGNMITQIKINNKIKYKYSP